MARPQVKKLSYIKEDDFHYGEAIEDLIRAHDNTTSQLMNDPNGSDIVPDKLTGIQAATSTQTLAVSGGATVQLGGGVHVAITDNSKNLGRAVRYFVEYDTDPNFTNPWVEHLGSARNRMLSLPNGTYFIRAYHQYPAGGRPSLPVYATQPVVVSNSLFPALLPSQASGTGSPATGGGHGAGKVIQRQ